MENRSLPDFQVAIRKERSMKIHEYQAKELFKKYDIPVPAGGVAWDPPAAVKTAASLSATAGP